MVCCGDAVEHKKPICAIEPNRSCTDILFLILFILFWGGLFAIMGRSLKTGNPDVLLRGVDIDGHICGVDEPVKDRKYAYFPDYTDYQVKYCAASCDETWLVQTCSYTQYRADYCESMSAIALKNETAKLWVYCYPKVITKELTDDFSSIPQTTARVMGDLKLAFGTIMAMGGIAILLCFFWMLIVRWLGGCIVWTSIVFSIGAGVGLGVFFFTKSNNLNPSDSELDNSLFTNNKDTLRVFAYVTWGLTGLLALIVLCLWNQLKVAIAVVKTASIAASDMKSMFIFPLLPFVVVVGYFCFFIWITVYIFSSGEFITRSDSVVKFRWNDDLKGAFAYHFFGLLWNVQFLLYFTYFVLAGAVADWYFRSPADRARLSGVVTRSAYRTVRYHLGTIAFGSMIIAIIKFIRFLVMYIKEKTHAKSNKLQECLFCMIQCCLWCMEKCLDFVSKNAFIYSTITGENFCTAGMHVLSLVLSNLGKIAAVTLVQDFLLLLGKVFVSVVTALIAAAIFTQAPMFKEDLTSPIMPIVVSFFFAFAISSIFVIVYEATIDTMIICYLVDVTNNPPEQLLVPETLHDLIKHYEKESTEMAKKLAPSTGDPAKVTPK